jgi:hypothetical protein
MGFDEAARVNEEGGSKAVAKSANMRAPTFERITAEWGERSCAARGI